MLEEWVAGWLSQRLTKHTAKVFSIKEILIAKKNRKLAILFTGHTTILLFPFFYCKE